MPTLGWLGVFLFIVSIAFEALPLMHSNALGTFHLIARQRVLEQRIVTDVLILAYRPQEEHAEALSELQTALPVWERVQKGLMNGDDTLGISPNLPSNIKLYLLQMQPDFSYMDTAARQILAHHSPVDPDQLAIILQHEQPYYLSMAQAVIVFQDDVDNAAKIYFSIELSIGIVLMSMWITFLLSFRSLTKGQNSKQKEHLS